MQPLAIVTGASGGIGSAVVEALEALDYFILKTDLYPNQDPPAPSSHSRAISLDLSHDHWADELRCVLEECPGELSLVVHAAGIETLAPITDLSAARQSFEVNYWPICTLTELLTRKAKASQSKLPRHIIAIGSFMAQRGHPERSAYSASKLALEAFIRNAAVELARYNIRAHCISPAWVDTPLAHRAIADIAAAMQVSAKEAEGYLQKRTPLRKFIQPQEIAKLITFLLGDGGASFTGQVLTVDNGLTAVIP